MISLPAHQDGNDLEKYLRHYNTILANASHRFLITVVIVNIFGLPKLKDRIT